MVLITRFRLLIFDRILMGVKLLISLNKLKSSKLCLINKKNNSNIVLAVFKFNIRY